MCVKRGRRRGYKTDLRGQRFNKVVVLRRARRNKWNQACYVCRCDCGRKFTESGTNIERKRKSCGCANYTDRSQGGLTGKFRREANSWRAMQMRCLYEDSIGFPQYGGRGITICDRWLGPGGFANFLADMGPRPKGKTLDRKNVEGNYTPDNCEWATPLEQAQHKRRNYTPEELDIMRAGAKAEMVEADPDYIP
jgi:hypothetical protein